MKSYGHARQKEEMNLLGPWPLTQPHLLPGALVIFSWRPVLSVYWRQAEEVFETPRLLSSSALAQGNFFPSRNVDSTGTG